MSILLLQQMRSAYMLSTYMTSFGTNARVFQISPASPLFSEKLCDDTMVLFEEDYFEEERA